MTHQRALSLGIEEAVRRVNDSGAVDFVVVSASESELVLLACVDDRSSLRARLSFSNVAYVQMPWRFSFRRLRADALTPVAETPMEPSGRASAPPLLPSVSSDDVRDFATEGLVLFSFVDDASVYPRSAGEPAAFVIAEALSVA